MKLNCFIFIKLTINQGVEIIFEDSCAFRILGEIEAVGTSTEPIIFKPGPDLPFWDIINLENTDNLCKFKHVHFYNHDMTKSERHQLAYIEVYQIG